MIKTYENKEGYKIRATEKAFKLFYEKQGFRPVESQSVSSDVAHDPVKNAGDDIVPPAMTGETVENPEDNISPNDTESESVKKISVREIKEALSSTGVDFPANATKSELLELLKKQQEG
ncbi:MAG: hypothetical protein ACI4R5_03235 [Acetatifactor sp.]